MGGLNETHILFTRQACQIVPRLHVVHLNNMKDSGLQQYLVYDSFGSNYRPSLGPQPVKGVGKGIPRV